MVQTTPLGGSLAKADLETLVEADIKLVNAFGPSQSAHFGVTDPDGALQSSDPNATATIPGHNDGEPVGITYLGTGTLSAANLTLLGVVNITVNEIEVGAFQDEAGQNFLVSEQPLDAANLQVSASVLGQNIGPMNLTALVSAVNNVLIVGSINTNQILNALVFDLDIDPGAAYQLDEDEFTVVCFLEGTLIATPGGERAVEDLAVGDLVMTADGTTVPVKWVGRQDIDPRRRRTMPEKMLPVCISAGALGKNLPHTDLYVSAAHGMIIDNLVIDAGALVNGTTIRFLAADEFRARLRYYHIETQDHNVILANGAPAETYIDYVARACFDNYQEYVDLYGGEGVIAEMPRLRISSRRQLPAGLAQRLGIASFERDVEAEYAVMMERLAAA